MTLGLNQWGLQNPVSQTTSGFFVPKLKQHGLVAETRAPTLALVGGGLKSRRRGHRSAWMPDWSPSASQPTWRSLSMHNTARSSIGEGYRSFKAERWVRFPGLPLEKMTKLE